MIDNFKTLEEMSPEQFAKECKKENVGNLHSMKVLVGVAYEQCRLINDDLMIKMKEAEEGSDELKSLQVLYDKLISVMQNLEDKYNIILKAIVGVPIA